MFQLVALSFFLTLFMAGPAARADQAGMTDEVAAKLAGLALRCVHKEYPNKPDHVMAGEHDVRNPEAMHPAFYGCYDWHSSVHGHWMLVRLLKTHPNLPGAAEIRAALHRSLAADKLQEELEYLNGPNRKSFERTYGWAWLLKLAEELHGWNDADGKQWDANIQSLARAFVKRYLEFLPKQNYPIRTGVHPNTAFALGFGLDYARKTGNVEFERLLLERSRAYFEHDANYPLMLEPGGEDFFSPALLEADLMRRVLPASQFPKWLEKFFGGYGQAHLRNILTPAVVLDRTDPKLVHLDGLNLSRAWCMQAIAAALPAASKGRKIFLAASARHRQAGLAQVTSGNYEGEHWLASFAVYLLAD